MPLVAAGAVATLWRHWSNAPAAAATGFCVAVAFALVAVRFRAEGRRTAMVLLLVAAAVLWPLAFLTAHGGDATRVGLAATSFFWAATTASFALYPDGRLRAWDWGFIGYCWLTLPGAEVVLVLIGQSYSEARFWLEPLNISTVFAVFAFFGSRWKRADYIERRSLTPLLGAVLIAGVVSGIANSVISYGSNTEHVTAALAVNSLAILCLPAALVHGTVRRRNDSLKVAEELGALVSAGAGHEELQRCLRAILHDDGLELLFWDGTADCYIDSAARPRTPDPSGRHLIQLEAPGGGPLAVIATRAAIERHPDLRRTVTSVGGMALVMQARVKVLELRSQEARIAEQERIQRDLHDRGQSGLAAVGMQLAVLSERARSDADLRKAVDVARRSLDAATKVLREIVEGMHPPLLTHHGLEPALGELAGKVVGLVPNLAFEPSLGPARFPTVVEHAAYCVVSEGIANSLRHAPGSSVAIGAAHADGVLSVSVADTGAGGAQLARGRGLLALRDRCRTVGGDLEITSGDAGTTLTARFPCTGRKHAAAALPA